MKCNQDRDLFTGVLSHLVHDDVKVGLFDLK